MTNKHSFLTTLSQYYSAKMTLQRQPSDITWRGRSPSEPPITWGFIRKWAVPRCNLRAHLLDCALTGRRTAAAQPRRSRSCAAASTLQSQLLLWKERNTFASGVRRQTVMVDGRPPQPLFTFGVIADVQYADIDDGYNFQRTNRRYYRNSLELLRNALDSWSKAAVKPGFILQLGDLIDGKNEPLAASDRALQAVLEELGCAAVDVHHVWGNHEFYNFSRHWLLSSKLNSSPQSGGGRGHVGGDVYAYHFSPHPGFTFVVLDAYDVALLGREESSPGYREALTVLRAYNRNDDLNRPPGIWFKVASTGHPFVRKAFRVTRISVSMVPHR